MAERVGLGHNSRSLPLARSRPRLAVALTATSRDIAPPFESHTRAKQFAHVWDSNPQRLATRTTSNRVPHPAGFLPFRILMFSRTREWFFFIF